MDKYAYVTVLYGNNIYLTGAIVVGYSLMKTGTKFPRIILVTPDVSDEYKTYLNLVFTQVIDIDYVVVDSTIFAEDTTRFRDVFTKLECLSLIQYNKIILLDLDMLITQNIDHLFKLSPPAACLKRYNYSYGKIIPADMMCKNGKLIGSINAGLMLFKPDKKELSTIKEDINCKQIHSFKYPEQDYLSLRYCGKWTSITFNYNYQFGLTHRTKKMHYTINDIYVIHYSSSYKPWNNLIKDRTISEDESKFQSEHHKYYQLWINAYNLIKKEFSKNGVILPY